MAKIWIVFHFPNSDNFSAKVIHYIFFISTEGALRLPMPTQWLPGDNSMTICDYPTTTWLLSDDYLMTIWWLSEAYSMTITSFWSIFLDDHWSKKSGATLIPRWSFPSNSEVKDLDRKFYRPGNVWLFGWLGWEQFGNQIDLFPWTDLRPKPK